MGHASGRILLACGAAWLLLAAAPASDDDVDPLFGAWETFGKEQGLPSDKVMAVAVDGPRAWAGTMLGLALIEEGRVRVFGTEQGLPFPIVTSLAVDPRSGDVWVGTLGGLACVSAGRVDAFTQLDSGLANDVIYGVGVLGDDVWIATAAGVSRYDQRTETWEIFDVTNTLMHEPWCYGIAGEGRTVHVAVWGGGVLVRDLDAGTWREHRDPDGEMEIDLYRDDGLLHDVTSAVAVDHGTLWAATYFGLSRYDGRRWRTWCAADSGLAGDFINHVAAADGAVWVATDQGLSRFDSREWYSWQRTEDGTGWTLTVTPDGGEGHTFPTAGGPASNTIYGVAVGGRDVWLATAAGLSHGIARPGDDPDRASSPSDDGAGR